MLGDALGPGGSRPLSQPPTWPSDVADDHTPVEFSTAFEAGAPPVVRAIVEPTAGTPSRRANTQSALDALAAMGRRQRLDLSRFDHVRELFLPDQPHSDFTFWYSLVFRAGEPPAVKVYFNPQVRGEHAADDLVREGLARTGFAGGHQTLLDHAMTRPGADRYSFFALDLLDRRRARVKVYVSHHDAEAAVAQRAAHAARDVDAERLDDFCRIVGGGTRTFDRRPLISSYTFLDGDTSRPSGYSLYLPVRDYVSDDAEAVARVHAAMAAYGLDTAQFDTALRSIAQRPLDEGVGLIAHVSLRTGKPRPGITVYLSSEAYDVASPRESSLAN
ncbi:tryptophan dimethylallyltransferase family protein [Saccharothrix coeruleofusca]|uniref:Prenyltransferase n=1 Tax=Saccharothrix coeruleofusca TaxID=33919 RepID=A0A918APZ2_9PSEU|nr:tryptophan dimethylallyltransferase family protein [Saccharothrix coeruleofusca]MBP2337141.1 DMATS type aromatic prenyltransferase [Saccharothrix coeruleofusca]GGP66829.1 prenyltransferase [Saccharothrix coeruleofusca]